MHVYSTASASRVICTRSATSTGSPLANDGGVDVYHKRLASRYRIVSAFYAWQPERRMTLAQHLLVISQTTNLYPGHMFDLQLHVAAEAPNSQGYSTTNPSTCSSSDACILSEVPHDPPIHPPASRLALANNEYPKLVRYHTCDFAIQTALQFPCHNVG